MEEAQARLLDRIIADWPRRRQTLFEIGSIDGAWLDFFWKAGFDVDGAAAHPEQARATKARLGDRAEVFLTALDHIPAADKSYDFAVLLHPPALAQERSAVFAEARRIARKGFVVVFVNRFSLYGLTRLRNRDGAQGLTRRPLVRELREVFGDKPVSCASTLLTPPLFWRSNRLLQAFNRPAIPWSVGALTALRVDLVNETPLTPLFALQTENGLSGASYRSPF